MSESDAREGFHVEQSPFFREMSRVSIESKSRQLLELYRLLTAGLIYVQKIRL